MHSKRKIPDSWRTGWKVKACTSFALYLKVFKNHLYYLWHVRVLSFKPCLHTQLLEHNRSYWKVSRWWGHLITCNGPIMGHLNSFSASGGGNFPKIFQKFKCPGVARGGCLSFDLTGTLAATQEITHAVHSLTIPVRWAACKGGLCFKDSRWVARLAGVPSLHVNRPLNIAGFHMTSLNFKLENYIVMILLRFYFHGV